MTDRPGQSDLTGDFEAVADICEPIAGMPSSDARQFQFHQFVLNLFVEILRPTGTGRFACSSTIILPPSIDPLGIRYTFLAAN